ncbi:methylenetetrahydrofolate--tRNA-(uracil-5-)-methyltransferase [Polymorphobacter multimanifer]|uniref:Methylenetetrahydrofolate--tRNA-(uracil-5-)-methyltransferase TrmFO n=1 Tax=Polymorphobacter multimanifer TaxID=1070431 RepID=A0A841L159_9SPHN|nr:methylenetetrahydrofolate--tRNA-(uracil(54)-C(5))-methyltransferase (FADH(2)-oxidizing) TrmFO [Polymorphobacter multimanifer]MBB6226294.1 methylenetetrahydrofolate--tRNA-(uracil-5-)-methyltransferase [Polymorphobacter multimanifer]
MTNPVHIIGGGLAGSEAAWQLAEAGVPVILHEMRGVHRTDAHHTDQLAELVCSNSFRSDDPDNNAVGLLHAEMRALGSLVMAAADKARVPAGSALAVDRDIFATHVTTTLESHPHVTIVREMVEGLPPAEWDKVIIATGPLTATPLAEAIQALTGQESLAFFDAIAPVIHHESIDLDIAWAQSRWDRENQDGGTTDYLNCPMDRDQYNAFIDAMLAAEKTSFKEWEGTPYFDGCMPIEVMAERGRNTPRFGPMKPVGLTNPATGRRAFGVVQLRQDNALGTLWNMVGFQTKMKHAEQVRVFRMIPGLENAQFARLGGLHRNTFIKSPVLLDATLRLHADPRIRFAGQITGCEGYVESAAIGLVAARFAIAEARGQAAVPPPATTAMGALLAHITGGADAKHFQPMNVNFGLFPPLVPPPLSKDQRKPQLVARARADLAGWMAA